MYVINLLVINETDITFPMWRYATNINVINVYHQKQTRTNWAGTV